MGDFFNIIFSTSFGYTVLRVMTPILFATLGCLIAGTAGVLNMALEGTMLIAAFTGVVVSAYTGSAWLGLLGAILIGAIMGLLMGYFAISLKTDIVLTGIAINLMASGGTIFFLYALCRDKGISSSLESKVLPTITLPLIDKIPILGPIVSGHNILMYISLLMVIILYYLLYRTSLGLTIRSVGENPDAADSVGISVIKTKYIALVLSGILAGLGGAYMSMGYVSWFSRDMTAGRGFIALAAKAMGGGTPLGTFVASLFFGFADALSNNLQSLRIPAEYVQMLPYVATIVGLVIHAINKQSKIKKIKMKQKQDASAPMVKVANK